MNRSSIGTSSTEPSPNALRSDQHDFLLIEQVLAGRSEQFWELVQPHIPVVSRLVYTRMRNNSEAEDVLQNTLLKAFTRLRQFRFESNFGTWFTRIAINETRQWYRTSLRSRVAGFEDHGIGEPQLAGASASPLEISEQQERVKLLHLALASLPEKYQSVIRLREFEHLSLAETARTLALSISAVKTRQRRARLRMIRDLSAVRRGPRLAVVP